MSLLYVLILATVQGFAEMLPVSSSAHVVVTEKLLGLDPSSPPMTLLLVMLHTGTMLAVIAYFWKQWRPTYFQSTAIFKKFAGFVVLATSLTGLIGEAIIEVIERTVFRGKPHAQVEDLFNHLELVAPALAVVGILILVAGIFEKKRSTGNLTRTKDLNAIRAGIIGGVQGLCLPFRGFSRSGATISIGMLVGVTKLRAEMFSFALAVVLTPFVVAREVTRVFHAEHASGLASLASSAFPSLIGMVFAFLAGSLALKWLNRWLERGRWYLFGIYCLIAAVGVSYLHQRGY